MIAKTNPKKNIIDAPSVLTTAPKIKLKINFARKHHETKASAKIPKIIDTRFMLVTLRQFVVKCIHKSNRLIS